MSYFRRRIILIPSPLIGEGEDDGESLIRLGFYKTRAGE